MFKTVGACARFCNVGAPNTRELEGSVTPVKDLENECYLEHSGGIFCYKTCQMCMLYVREINVTKAHLRVCIYIRAAK